MNNPVLVLAAVLFASVFVLQLLTLWRTRDAGSSTEIAHELRAVLEEVRARSREIQEDLDATEARLRQEALLRTNESHRAIDAIRDALERKLSERADADRQHWDALASRLQSQARESRDELDRVRLTIDQKLTEIQASNEQKLEKMREVVDEKLQSTIEKRLGESFNQVSQHLAHVQRGLGEMQVLAQGVGDLNRVLNNVKCRGVYGEAQLRAILEDTLRPEQYVADFAPSQESRESVEFAVRMPGASADGDEPIYLPIDAKFPKDDYERLVLAIDNGDKQAADEFRAALVQRITRFANDINTKYINPPHTTSFALMFLPTEGLYAEVLREPGLHDKLRREFGVIVTGPTTIAAILNSLALGFQTVAIERRSSEVRKVLGAVRSEFAKFAQILHRVQKQLGSASRSIEDTFVRTRAMERKLKGVEALPEREATQILELSTELPVLSEDSAEHEEQVPTDTVFR